MVGAEKWRLIVSLHTNYRSYPELIRNQIAIPAIRSVGVIVYIMVSGYSPFMGDDDNQTYGNISMCDYEFYEEEFANISEDCKDFIKNLLLIKPSWV